MVNPLLQRPGASASAAAPSAIGGPSLGGPGGPGGPKLPGAKSLQRKRPVGLSIDKAIESARATPPFPQNVLGGLSEAEQLRADIAKLQLSDDADADADADGDLDGRGRAYADESPAQSPTSTTSHPRTPTTLAHSDSSSGSKKKKEGGTSKKKVKLDKDGLEFVKNEDLDVLGDIGAGNGGTVTKVWNKKRKCVMARKLILVDAKPQVRKQILRELQIMNDCNSPYIVGFHGCFPADVHVGVVMEHMDAGSLDDIYRRNGAIPIQIVGKVAEAVLRGLMYLYDVHRIIHRDIKPSNILANTAGEIKICDFGVSGELINSIANTFVGTSTYMSPERIQGAAYSIKSDVWSLGISLVELATGRFPFQDPPDSGSDSEGEGEGEDGDDLLDFDPDPTLPISTRRPNLIELQSRNKRLRNRGAKGVSLGGGGHTMSILDLLQHIVNEDAPELVSKRRVYPEEARAFVRECLRKDPKERMAPGELLASEWITGSVFTQDDVREWAQSLDKGE